jgi:hypothetical protein
MLRYTIIDGPYKYINIPSPILVPPIPKYNFKNKILHHHVVSSRKNAMKQNATKTRTRPSLNGIAKGCTIITEEKNRIKKSQLLP